MKPLGDLLSSKARTDILRALCVLPNPPGIRHLARLTRLHPRSVELALHALSEEGMVSRSPSKGRASRVKMRRGHEAYPRLCALFEADDLAEIANRPPALDKKAPAICAFMDEGHRLIHHGRRSLHDAD